MKSTWLLFGKEGQGPNELAEAYLEHKKFFADLANMILGTPGV